MGLEQQGAHPEKQVGTPGHPQESTGKAKTGEQMKQENADVSTAEKTRSAQSAQGLPDAPVSGNKSGDTKSCLGGLMNGLNGLRDGATVNFQNAAHDIAGVLFAPIPGQDNFPSILPAQYQIDDATGYSKTHPDQVAHEQLDNANASNDSDQVQQALNRLNAIEYPKKKK